VEPFKHYLHFGWHAGLDPSAGFSTRFYLSALRDRRPTRGIRCTTTSAWGRCGRPLHRHTVFGRRRYSGWSGGRCGLAPPFSTSIHRAAIRSARPGRVTAFRLHLEGWRAGARPGTLVSRGLPPAVPGGRSGSARDTPS
jgi:hypothetical protein